MLTNSVRIIAGSLKGRKIEFSSRLDLRPTPDRVKETLFAWLEPYIKGAQCLDLFAGSGALSFEAISRGAAFVLAVDQSLEVIRNLDFHSQKFQTEKMKFLQKDALSFLKKEASPFDIIFLDPPYKVKGLLKECLDLIIDRKWIHQNSIIYYESNEPVLLGSVAEFFDIVREKKAGNIYFYLAKYKPPQSLDSFF